MDTANVMLRSYTGKVIKMLESLNVAIDESESIHGMAEDTTSTELTCLKPQAEYSIHVWAKTV